MADKLLTHLDIPSTSIIPDARTGFVRIYSRNNLVYAKDENGTETQLTNSNTPPVSGDEVTNERVQYDRPEIIPNVTVGDVLIPTVSEGVPLITEEVVAALLARAEESVPTPEETIRTTVRPMIDEVVPSTQSTESVITARPEIIPLVTESFRFDFNVLNESVPFPTEEVRIVPTVMAFESVPLITDNASASIIEQDNFLPVVTTSEPLNATLNGYANQNVATTVWATPANALGNTTNTASTLTATASGLAGATNTTVTGAITLGFQDVNLGDLNITSVILSVENLGAVDAVAVVQPTTSVEWQYSLNNGGAFTTFYTMSTPATAKGIRTVDVTGIVGQNQALLSGLQIQATGTITSGTGLGVANTVSFFRAWMTVLANKTY